MPDQGLRARVVRMLGGDFRPEDLTRLFLYARDRCDGRQAVQEIGDFVAHQSERTKGIITRETRDWFVIVKFIIPRLQQDLSAQPLPSYFPQFLQASFRRASPDLIKQAVGVRSAEASQLLKSAIGRFVSNADGTYSGPVRITRREAKLIEALCSHLVVRPAFDNDRLFSELTATLKSLGLLEKREIASFSQLKPAIGLFAASLMHKSGIMLEEKSVCALEAAIQEGQVEVMAAVPVDIPGKGTVHVASSIYNSGVVANDHCEDSLLSAPRRWDFDIELNSRKKLDRLG